MIEQLKLRIIMCLLHIAITKATGYTL